MIASRWYSDIWTAILFGQFLIHGKVHLVLRLYPKKFRLKSNWFSKTGNFVSFLCELLWGKMIARMWYSDICRAVLWGKFLILGKVHLVVSWYPKKFRLKIKWIFRNWPFYVIFMWKVGRKNDCLDVIERYMKSNSVGKISSSWQSTLGFELISKEISFKNQINLHKLTILCHFYVKSWEER